MSDFNEKLVLANEKLKSGNLSADEIENIVDEIDWRCIEAAYLMLDGIREERCKWGSLPEHLASFANELEKNIERHEDGDESAEADLSELFSSEYRTAIELAAKGAEMKKPVHRISHGQAL